MKRIYVIIAAITLTLAACNQKVEQQIETTLEEVSPNPEVLDTLKIEEEETKDQTVLVSRALSQEFIDYTGQKTTLQDIVAKHKGKTVFIDIWASWCPDCLKAVPAVNDIKKEFNSTVFVNLSLDKTEEKWKEAIAKYSIDGEHYFSTEGKGMKGDFGKSLDLNWIPRYIILDKDGKVAIYNATEKDFEKIKDTLKKNQ